MTPPVRYGKQRRRNKLKPNISIEWLKNLKNK